MIAGQTNRKQSSRLELRGGFSLVELLIVITILGILIGLLTPAIQSSREAARKTQCKNNLRQLGLAASYHLNASSFFPSSGWGYRWAGDPDFGFGATQPGGWLYSVLPYIEEKGIWNAGAGISFVTNRSAKEVALLGQVSTPLSLIICPSRRDISLYPFSPARAPVNLNAAALAAGVLKTDYAINVGDADRNQYPGPDSMTQVTSGKYQWPNNGDFTGVSFQRSEVTVPKITDGLTHTYLIGEKYMNPVNYTNGQDNGDNDAATQGFDNDSCRMAGLGNGPMMDTAAFDNFLIFGSAHAEGFNMTFCDGSVHMIEYSIDPEVHNHLANRADGQSVSSNAIH